MTKFKLTYPTTFVHINKIETETNPVFLIFLFGLIGWGLVFIQLL